MMSAFAEGRDIYQETAVKLVGRKVDKDDPARQAAKRATLGFLYGLGTEKYRTNVYKDTGERLSKAQAERDRKAFRVAFPDFYKWQRSYGTRKEWETRSVLGWRRVVGLDIDGEPKYTDRLNGPIQSTAGDILYLTLEKPLNVGRGFDSATSVKDAADRFGSGGGITVLYFGDFDPSGEDMVRSLRERLAELGSEPEIIKCALTFEDIERYDLPPDFTKATDSRSAAFVARYGDVAVELDALPVNVLRERITNEVRIRMDLEALQATRRAERADRRRLDELLS
jgi:DNA polymerase family A